MLHAPIDLPYSQQLLQDAKRVLEHADALLARSRELVARGEARAVACACAAMAYEGGRTARREETRAPCIPVTILLIDDEPGFVSALARILRQDGDIVDTAADGHLALVHLQAQRYDVVLCDLWMPGLDGPDFYAILCHQYTPTLTPARYMLGLIPDKIIACGIFA
jgi:PleD family two-component response regulator